MSTYKTLKKVLETGNKNGVVTEEKLDVFLIGNRLTEEEYKELLDMLRALDPVGPESEAE